MRLKYYLRGAGVGIIFATLVLMISGFYRDSYSKVEDVATVSEETIEKSEAEEVADTDTATDDLNEEESQDNIEVSNDTSVVDFVISDVNEVVDQIDVEETTDSTNNDVSKTYVAFTINNGDSSRMVSFNLYDAGLVEDPETFNKYLSKLGIAKYIQPGTFYVKKGIDQDELAALLVTKQDERTTSAPEATPEAPVPEANNN